MHNKKHYFRILSTQRVCSAREGDLAIRSLSGKLKAGHKYHHYKFTMKNCFMMVHEVGDHLLLLSNGNEKKKSKIRKINR